jgi:hypothetical protein
VVPYDADRLGACLVKHRRELGQYGGIELQRVLSGMHVGSRVVVLSRPIRQLDMRPEDPLQRIAPGNNPASRRTLSRNADQSLT